MKGSVVGVHLSATHSFSKKAQLSIELLEGLGVEGDAHCGTTVQHRFHAARDPLRPNRRQVHLIESERFDELAGRGFDVGPGDLGENIATRGIALAALPTGTRLHLGAAAIIELTGLRTPCVHIERFRSGLLAQVVDRGPKGELIPKAGVMAVVVRGGTVMAGDPVAVQLPSGAPRPLAAV